MPEKLLPHGHHAPPMATLPYRLLTRSGLSRGVICQWIRRQWIAKHPTIVDAVIHGIKFRLDIKNNATDGKILTSSKFYDKAEIQALSPQDGPVGRTVGVFLDIGANTGYYSLSLAGLYSKVIAIEPNPPTLRLLRQNVSLNELESKISIIPLCIGEGGAVPFYCGGDLGGASLIGGGDVEPIWVESAPLLDILEKSAISRIDAMKIDIEGYEDRALLPFFNGAPKALWPITMVIENCHRAMWDTDIIEKMVEMGYVEIKKTKSNSILRRS
jgi:FkbM family methyltransferase